MGEGHLDFMPEVARNHCKPNKRKTLCPGGGDKSESGSLFPELMSKLNKTIVEIISAAIRPA